MTRAGQHPWLRPGWKILPKRLGYYSNTNCTCCFRRGDNRVDFTHVQPHYRRMPVLSKLQQLPAVLPDGLLRRSQRTNPPNTKGSAAFSLQNKGGLHQDVFMATSACELVTSRTSSKPTRLSIPHAPIEERSRSSRTLVSRRCCIPTALAMKTLL